MTPPVDLVPPPVQQALPCNLPRGRPTISSGVAALTADTPSSPARGVCLRAKTNLGTAGAARAVVPAAAAAAAVVPAAAASAAAPAAGCGPIRRPVRAVGPPAAANSGAVPACGRGGVRVSIHAGPPRMAHACTAQAPCGRVQANHSTAQVLHPREAGNCLTKPTARKPVMPRSAVPQRSRHRNPSRFSHPMISQHRQAPWPRDLTLVAYLATEQLRQLSLQFCLLVCI